MRMKEKKKEEKMREMSVEWRMGGDFIFKKSYDPIFVYVKITMF